MIEGKIGSKALTLTTEPKGKEGVIEVMLANGKTEKVSWVRDEQGIWIETSSGFFGYDVRKTESDDGSPEYELLRRKQFEVESKINFLKRGEGGLSGEQKAKKGVKIKSQMPGKIVRILVKVGDAVIRGQSLLVMEAMKMENEIKSPQDGIIKEIKVKESQAIETGAELLLFV